MYPPIVCRCGRPIGDIRQVYDLMMAEVFKRAGLTNPDTARFTADVSCNEVISALKIKRDCCKIQLMSHIEFKSYVE